MVNVVVVGDIGRPNVYHTGDEAMTDAAIDLLRARGVDQVVLVAEDPELATQAYGCPAVPRIAFRNGWSPERCEAELAELQLLLTKGWEQSGPRATSIEAVANADALLIAGGGNLRSEHRYMIYERLALVRVARHFNKPVLVTSQTIGPMLEERDKPLIAEIIDAATCFGVREPSTQELARGLAADPNRVVLTMDDSVLLDPRPTDFESLSPFALPGRFVVGSFTYHAGTTGMPPATYRSYLAGVLDAVAERSDAEVLLVPHVGAFTNDLLTHDRANDAGIVAASRSGRLRALPVLTARQAIALTSGAQLSISTRYHATVFGTSRGVPSVGLVTSYYSAVRMAGALGNVGVDQYALPADAWSGAVLPQAVDEAQDATAGLASHLEQLREVRRASQEQWWDALAAAIRGEGWSRPPDLAPSPVFRSGDWGRRVVDTRTFAEQNWRACAALKRSVDEAAGLASRLQQAKDQLEDQRRRAKQAEGALRRLRRHPAIRLASRLRRLVRRASNGPGVGAGVPVTRSGTVEPESKMR